MVRMENAVEIHVLTARKEWSSRGAPRDSDGYGGYLLRSIWHAHFFVFYLFREERRQDSNVLVFTKNILNHFRTYVDHVSVGYGPGVPAAFRQWLVDPATGAIRRSKHTRVAFGPDGSFFAWDVDSMRWSNVPPDFEETIQSWISPSGWLHGPPRIVALGVNKSFFILSEYGAFATQRLPKPMSTWIKNDIKPGSGRTIEVGSHISSITNAYFI